MFTALMVTCMAIIQTVRIPFILFAIIGSALTAGIFFAFSTFVMQALGQQPPASGIAAMQSINLTVINPWFMTVFWGPAVVGLGFAFALLRQWNQVSTLYWVAGVMLYIVGAIGVTIAGNLPLNHALATVSPNSAAGAALWARYLSVWTVWNHVRTVAAVLTSVLFTLSLLQQPGLADCYR